MKSKTYGKKQKRYEKQDMECKIGKNITKTEEKHGRKHSSRPENYRCHTDIYTSTAYGIKKTSSDDDDNQQ